MGSCAARPQVIWPAQDAALWDQAQAHYHRSAQGGGREMPAPSREQWTVRYGALTSACVPWASSTPACSRAGRQLGLDERAGSARAGPSACSTSCLYRAGATAACLAAGAGSATWTPRGMVAWARRTRSSPA